MVNFDNFGGLTSVLKFHIFLIFKNQYRIPTYVKKWHQMLSDVKNWYQIITDKKKWYLIFTDVNDRICNI